MEAQKELLQAEMEKLQRPSQAEDVKRLQREVFNAYAVVPRVVRRWAA